MRFLGTLKVERGFAMMENERAMYMGVTMNHRTEVALQWQRNGLFLLINLALVTVLGGFLQRGDFPAFIPIAMSIAGMATGFLWWIANSHTNDWILYWESCLRAIELSEPSPIIHRVYAGPEFERLKKRALATNRWQLRLIRLTIVIWFAVLAVEVWKASI